MHRLAVLFVAALMVVGTSAVPATASAQPGPAAGLGPPTLSAGEAENVTNETNESDVAPGERLAGVLGVGRAEFEGELENRTFRIKLDRAATPEAKAEIIAVEVSAIQTRLATLENRTERLQNAHENGTMSDGEFRAKMATVVAQVEAVKRLGNASNRTAASLPAEVLKEKGVNATALNRVRRQADNLTAPGVSEIARQIAGPSVGTRMANPKTPVNISQPGEVGPPDDTPGRNRNQSGESGPKGIPGSDGNQSDGPGPPDDTPGGDGNQSDKPGPPDDKPGDENNHSDESGPSDDKPGNHGNESNESGSPGDSPGNDRNQSDPPTPSDGNPGDDGNQSDEGNGEESPSDGGNKTDESDSSRQNPADGGNKSEGSGSADDTPPAEKKASDGSGQDDQKDPG